MRVIVFAKLIRHLTSEPAHGAGACPGYARVSPGVVVECAGAHTPVCVAADRAPQAFFGIPQR